MASNDICIYGKNSVIEYMDSGGSPKFVLLRTGIKIDGRIRRLIKICSNRSIDVRYTSENELNGLTKNANHQGVVIVAKGLSKKEFMIIEDILDILENTDRSLIVMLDSIQDTHNMGAIIRSAEFFGVSAVVLPKKDGAPINNTVYKTSSGAVENVKISYVNNFRYAIDLLKRNGYYVYGTCTDDNAFSLGDVFFEKKSVVVLGSEGKGIRKSVKDSCDSLISIKGVGKINSLNVSVSAGVVFYEYARQILRFG